MFDGKNVIGRFIYDLFNDGIHGATKKDVVLAILSEIAVSLPFIWPHMSRYDASIQNSHIDVCSFYS